VQLIGELSADLRFAVRTLGRHKAFAVMAIATLAVGLGANIAAFSAFDAVLGRNLPVEKPEQLVTFDWLRTNDSMVAGYSGYGRPGPVSGTGIRTSFSRITFHRFRQSSQTLSDIFAFAERYRLNVEASGQTDSASGQLVSGNYFNALGVPPLMGRVLTELDDTRPPRRWPSSRTATGSGDSQAIPTSLAVPSRSIGGRWSLSASPQRASTVRW